MWCISSFQILERVSSVIAVVKCSLISTTETNTWNTRAVWIRATGSSPATSATGLSRREIDSESTFSMCMRNTDLIRYIYLQADPLETFTKKKEKKVGKWCWKNSSLLEKLHKPIPIRHCYFTNILTLNSYNYLIKDNSCIRVFQQNECVFHFGTVFLLLLLISFFLFFLRNLHIMICFIYLLIYRIILSSF